MLPQASVHNMGDALSAPPATPDAIAYIRKVLGTIRTHLGMDVAFASEFTGGRRVFRAVDAAEDDCPVVAGASDPLEETYCQRVVDGRMPEIVHDAGDQWRFRPDHHEIDRIRPAERRHGPASRSR